jgi:Fe-S-cluster containining protein
MEHKPSRPASAADNRTVTFLGSDPGNARCLSIHAGYLCQHSGACCTAGWPIAVETKSFATLRAHFGGDRALFDTSAPRPEGAAAIVGVQGSGACVFFEADRGRLCSIHRELGEAYLPDACRQFPRVVLHDARGLLISLSHFCPTAAALLLDPTPVRIVPAPASLALNGAAVGLDARGALPPLLRPGLLTDLDGYAAWESRALHTLLCDDLTADQALAIIDAATRRIQDWRPGGLALADAVGREFDVASAPEDDEDLEADADRFRRALDSVPAGLETPPPPTGFAEGWSSVSPWWPSADRAVRTYLAARLFGNWVAYHGQGLHAIVEYLRVSQSAVKVEAVRHHAGAASSPWQTVIEAIRNADLLLVHLCDPNVLSRRIA